MPTNKPLAAAAILTFLTLGLHIFGGGPQYHDTALLSNLTTEEKAMYSVLWHAVTVTLAIGTAVFALNVRNKTYRPASLTIIAQFIGFSALFIFYGATKLGTLLPLGQWIIFASIAAIAIWGLGQQTNKQ